MSARPGKRSSEKGNHMVGLGVPPKMEPTLMCQLINASLLSPPPPLLPFPISNDIPLPMNVMDDGDNNM